MADLLTKNQTFATPTAALSHYGVKGMRWGVRKEEVSATENAQTKAYISETPKPIKPSLSEVEKSLADQEMAFAKKAGFRITRKQALVGVGAALTAGGAYYAISRSDISPSSAVQKLRGGYPKPGTKLSADEFSSLRQKSQLQVSLHNGYLTPKSYLQEEFTLPVGHVFHRISDTAETTFRERTYALHSDADYNRYLSEFSRPGSGFGNLHKVSFTAKTPIRVPSLTQRLDVLKETMSSDGRVPTDSEVLREYGSLMKTYWSEPRANAYFVNLRKKGFGAIVDDADAGIAGESPLLLLNADNFSAKSSAAVTQKDVEDARGNLTEIRNRK